MAERIRLNFKNLPLAEAAVRASFEQPIELSFASLMQLHGAIKSDFPIISEPQQIEAPPGITGQVAFGPTSVLGAVFQGHTDGLSISLQRQVVVVRWLRRIEPSAPAYPRFNVVRDTLWQAIDGLAESLAHPLPPVVVTNMSYVNFLAIGHEERILDLYFSRLIQVEAVKNASRVRKLEVSWQERDGVDLRVSLDQASMKQPGTEIQGFQLTTAAGLKLCSGGSSDPKAGLDSVHDRLQIFFDSLISEKAKQEWQLETQHD